MKLRIFAKGAIIAAAMIFFFAIFTLPAGASGLAMVKIDPPQPQSQGNIDKAEPNTTPNQLLSNRSLKNLIVLPQP